MKKLIWLLILQWIFIAMPYLISLLNYLFLGINAFRYTTEVTVYLSAGLWIGYLITRRENENK